MMNQKNKQKQAYEGLIGKTREEVVKQLGEGFNYYQNKVWTYNLRRDWLGRWVYLYLTFEDNKVADIRIGR